MFAGDNLKKFGFGGVIGSDKGDFIAVVDRQGKVIKQLLSVNGLGELFGFQNFFSAFAVGFKVKSFSAFRISFPHSRSALK